MPSRMRGFEVVEDWARKNKDIEIDYPQRSTRYSAGYDFFLCKDIELEPYKPQVYWTDIKSYMLPDEFLEVFIRSSVAIKKRVILANQTGIIDCDYYSNQDNDGNIGICLVNMTAEPVKFYAGDKIAQGVFTKYFVADGEREVTKTRTGGVGSTDK